MDVAKEGGTIALSWVGLSCVEFILFTGLSRTAGNSKKHGGIAKNSMG